MLLRYRLWRVWRAHVVAEEVDETLHLRFETGLNGGQEAAKTKALAMVRSESRASASVYERRQG